MSANDLRRTFANSTLFEMATLFGPYQIGAGQRQQGALH